MIRQSRFDEPEKACFKCGQVKALSLFYRHSQMGDGHLNKCKECTKRDVQKNYSSNLEHYAAYERARTQTEARKNWALKQQQRQRWREPEKDKARRTLNYHIRAGNISKQPCEACGELKVEAHHEDYSNPLEVRWLCHLHHRKVHQRVTEAREQMATLH